MPFRFGVQLGFVWRGFVSCSGCGSCDVIRVHFTRLHGNRFGFREIQNFLLWDRKHEPLDLSLSFDKFDKNRLDFDFFFFTNLCKFHRFLLGFRFRKIQIVFMRLKTQTTRFFDKFNKIKMNFNFLVNLCRFHWFLSGFGFHEIQFFLWDWKHEPLDFSIKFNKIKLDFKSFDKFMQISLNFIG